MPHSSRTCPPSEKKIQKREESHIPHTQLNEHPHPSFLPPKEAPD